MTRLDQPLWRVYNTVQFICWTSASPRQNEPGTWPKLTLRRIQICLHEAKTWTQVYGFAFWCAFLVILVGLVDHGTSEA